jgi:uncharacterized protein (TIGR02145 family)
MRHILVPSICTAFAVMLVVACASSCRTAEHSQSEEDALAEQKQIEAIQEQMEGLRAEIRHHRDLLSGTKPIPYLWVKKTKLGMNSINISGDTISFGDAGVNPSLSGELQRNRDSLAYAGSIQPGDNQDACGSDLYGALRWAAFQLQVCTISGWETIYDGTFGCSGTLTDARDAQTYATTLIPGNSAPYCTGLTQCWMAENLNVGVQVTSNNTGSSHSEQTDNGIIEKYCYANNSANCPLYGGLYASDEMLSYGAGVIGNGPGPQGICPAGWHVPTQNEWLCMRMSLGQTQAEAETPGFGGTDEGGQMKEAGTTYWSAPNTGATNSSGFSARGSGRRNTFGDFSRLGIEANYWTADGTAFPTFHRLMNSSTQVYQTLSSPPNGYSVRCVKD